MDESGVGSIEVSKHWQVTVKLQAGKRCENLQRLEGGYILRGQNLIGNQTTLTCLLYA